MNTRSFSASHPHPHPHSSPRPHMAIAALVLFLLSGCATLSSDAGFGAVEQTAKNQLGKELMWARSDAEQGAIDKRVAQALEQPLSVDDAVQIALFNNKGLQAAFNELGIADADRVQAGRWPNPGFSFGRLQQGPGFEIDRSLTFNLARWLMLPAINQMESQRFAQAQRAALLSVLTLASHTAAISAGMTMPLGRNR